MLVLTLNEGDYILIGDNIRVHFDYKLGKDTLSLAIEAPEDLSVLRGRLFEAGGIDAKKKASRPKESNYSKESGYPKETDYPKVKMLLLTIAKKEYVMIGNNIRIKYERNDGKGAFRLSVAAPRELGILRQRLYEGEIGKRANEGDFEAQVISDLLQDEHEQRRKISEARRAKGLFHKERVKALRVKATL